MKGTALWRAIENDKSSLLILQLESVWSDFPIARNAVFGSRH